MKSCPHTYPDEGGKVTVNLEVPLHSSPQAHQVPFNPLSVTGSLKSLLLPSSSLGKTLRPRNVPPLAKGDTTEILLTKSLKRRGKSGNDYPRQESDDNRTICRKGSFPPLSLLPSIPFPKHTLPLLKDLLWLPLSL